jgi:uncharacterized protein YqeY
MLELRLRADLQDAIRARDTESKNAIKMVLGEIPRLNKKAGEKATDSEITDIINKLIKSESLVLEYSGIDSSDSVYIKILKKYLPEMMTEEEISKWIDSSIDLTSVSNKMSAMKPIMAQLKGLADGSLVKKVLMEK